MPNSCLPFFAFCSSSAEKAAKTVVEKAEATADVNNDGKVDLNDIKAAAAKVAKFLNINEDTAQAQLTEFASKINKAILYLTAAKAILTVPENKYASTLEMVDKSLTILSVLQVAINAVKDIGGQLLDYKAPKDIVEVGKTIDDMMKTNVSIQAYIRLLSEVLKIDINTDQLMTLNETFADIKKVQSAWLALTNTSGLKLNVI